MKISSPSHKRQPVAFRANFKNGAAKVMTREFKTAVESRVSKLGSSGDVAILSYERKPSEEIKNIVFDHFQMVLIPEKAVKSIGNKNFDFKNLVGIIASDRRHISNSVEDIAKNMPNVKEGVEAKILKCLNEVERKINPTL